MNTLSEMKDEYEELAESEQFAVVVRNTNISTPVKCMCVYMYNFRHLTIEEKMQLTLG